MPIVHIVLFEFKPTTSHAQVEDGGFSHAFVSEFQSEEDRKYYLEEDPAHLAFVKSLEGVMQNVRVLDFEPGKF
ncbi:hypothetical protein LTR36_010687 [Oleoguttula mirabilis]|uniref:Stress-response A/B barrel domain-containing protein n=1 Tax=Oleoguttula mirabilis TaxID=1507867 RepID=A0AAV9JSF0_9PEZI|nr:hypothetical protein LTR36_010687 [Oleoguttula mirabilis]